MIILLDYFKTPQIVVFISLEMPCDDIIRSHIRLHRSSMESNLGLAKPARQNLHIIILFTYIWTNGSPNIQQTIDAKSVQTNFFFVQSLR